MVFNIFYNTTEYIITDDEAFFTSYNTPIKIESVEYFKDIKNTLHYLLKDAKNVIVYCKEITIYFEEFKTYFKYIIACGGVVLNDKEELLLIFRNGHWDLPKGKIEEAERFDECAVREVMEETGIAEPILEHFMLSTFHVYNLHNQFFLKESKWYLMRAKKTQKTFIPQVEEGITQVIWKPIDDSIELLGNSYPSFMPLLKKIELIK